MMVLDVLDRPTNTSGGLDRQMVGIIVNQSGGIGEAREGVMENCE